jgi:FMN phosphatase YigB (HAD superfamily)
VKPERAGPPASGEGARHLLLDLDGTILGLDMEAFIPRMISLMKESFGELLPSYLFLEGLRAGLETMIRSADPSRTVMEVFLENFAQMTSLPAGEAESAFEDFYRGPFRSLSGMASRIDGSAELVEKALEEGISVTLATNPIFPLPAIEERLSWAGMAHSSFRLITSAEVMHYCKPNPDYYREILSKLGALPGECLMAGNDQDLDLAAKEVGIRTFLVTEDYPAGESSGREPDFRGNLTELAALITGLKT